MEAGVKRVYGPLRLYSQLRSQSYLSCTKFNQNSLVPGGRKTITQAPTSLAHRFDFDVRLRLTPPRHRPVARFLCRSVRCGERRPEEGGQGAGKGFAEREELGVGIAAKGDLSRPHGPSQHHFEHEPILGTAELAGKVELELVPDAARRHAKEARADQCRLQVVSQRLREGAGRRQLPAEGVGAIGAGAPPKLKVRTANVGRGLGAIRLLATAP